MRPRFPLFERWEPHELGYSLPIAQRLKKWAIGLVLVGLAAAGVVAWLVRDLGKPSTEPAEDAFVQQTVLDRLSRVELPVWEPGGQLEQAPLPAFAPSAMPPTASTAHPGDPRLREPARLQTALRELPGGDVLYATTELSDMKDRQPRSWILTYNTGLGFLLAGIFDRATPTLEQARDRLQALASSYGGNPKHYAAEILTRYALGHVGRQEDCIQAIRNLKLSVGHLDRFVEAGGARAPDRRLPYRIQPYSLSNLDVWGALIEAYLSCEAYPAQYSERYGQETQDFRQAEYDDPNALPVQQGPFPTELAACIESNGATSRCWALSNLNTLYMANRSLLEPEKLPRAFDRHREDLARLAYNTARLVAEGPTPELAPEILLQARRLEPDDPDLSQRIEDLGRHLGAKLQNYTVLAEPFRGRSVEALDISPETPDDDLKGMAWALREQWQQLLKNRKPKQIFEEVAAARQHVPATYLDSLDAWEAGSREALREALADEIRVQKRRGNQAMAVGLRDFRADYLGDSWPERAEAAWWTWGSWLEWLAWLLALALFFALLIVLYRSVVYPYVMYTTDFYRAEFERRKRERKSQNLPVTGQEIFDRQKDRREES